MRMTIYPTSKEVKQHTYQLTFNLSYKGDLLVGNVE